MHQWEDGTIGYSASDSISHQDVSCGSISDAGRVHLMQCADYEYVPCALCERYEPLAITGQNGPARRLGLSSLYPLTPLFI